MTHELINYETKQPIEVQFPNTSRPIHYTIRVLSGTNTSGIEYGHKVREKALTMLLNASLWGGESGGEG